MRIPYIAAVTTLALVACQKTANTNDNLAMANDVTTTNEMTTTNDMSASAMAGDNAMASANATTADKAFLMDAIKGDNGEIAIGKLAAAQGMSQKAKDFGNMLATDHGAHKDKVAALLTSAGGSPTDEASDEGKANLARLEALHGAAFDKAFQAAMIDDHNKDIAKYEKQAAGKDPATAQLATETLPTLKKHLATAKAL